MYEFWSDYAKPKYGEKAKGYRQLYQTNQCIKEEIKKIIGLMKMMKIKKQKIQKKVCMKRKLKFQDYKNCLEAAQIENKINHQKKIKLMQIV